MCELLVIKSDETIPIDWIFHYAKLLEEYGVAGFGWGVAWKSESGEIRRYRATEGIKKDQLAAQALEGVQAKEYLVHLRKPSLMKSISFYNSQPYLNEDHSLAFAHNGFFSNHSQYRDSFSYKLEGTSDSEVGYQYYVQRLNEHGNSKNALELTHRHLAGKANLIAFRKDVETLIYAGNEDNSIYVFNLEGIKCAATALHSQDDFIFEAIFPTATAIQQIPLFSVCELTTGNLITNN